MSNTNVNNNNNNNNNNQQITIETEILENSPLILNEEINRESNEIPVIHASSVTNEMDINLQRERTSALSALRFTRELIERRTTERTRNWRDNLNNVFMEIRPLVQQAQRVNNNGLLTSWIPNNSRILNSSNSNVENRYNHSNHDESFIINFDSNQSNSLDYIVNQNLPNTTHNALNQSNSLDYIVNQHLQSIPHNDNNLNQIQNNTNTHNENDNVPEPINTNNNNNNNNSVNNVNPVNNNRNHHHHHNHHHNNTNSAETIAQFPETRAVLTTLNRYLPYVFILIVKSCYDHIDGILNIFALFTSFAHANYVVRQEIAKQHQKKILPLVRELIYIILVIAIIGFILERKNIFISLIFTTTLDETLTLKNLLFSVFITDLILKLITVFIKILITLLPPTMIEYKGRGRIYLMTESLSQLYRALAPIQLWLVYLFDSYTGSEKIMGVILSAVYMAAKGSDIINRAKFCKTALIKLLQKVSFGVNPTKEQLQSAGGQCPICHDDFNSPVLLECNHIFCETCVGTWFDREQTCPLCRAKVVDDPSWRDGSTTFFVQFY